MPVRLISGGKQPDSLITCRPQQPTAFMMEALWMTLYGIPAFTALSTRSLWVVALQDDGV